MERMKKTRDKLWKKREGLKFCEKRQSEIGVTGMEKGGNNIPMGWGEKEEKGRNRVEQGYLSKKLRVTFL